MNSAPAALKVGDLVKQPPSQLVMQVLELLDGIASCRPVNAKARDKPKQVPIDQLVRVVRRPIRPQF